MTKQKRECGEIWAARASGAGDDLEGGIEFLLRELDTLAMNGIIPVHTARAARRACDSKRLYGTGGRL